MYAAFWVSHKSTTSGMFGGDGDVRREGWMLISEGRRSGNSLPELRCAQCSLIAYNSLSYLRRCVHLVVEEVGSKPDRKWLSKCFQEIKLPCLGWVVISRKNKRLSPLYTDIC